jgi:HD-like signal output (HDOD) protein
VYQGPDRCQFIRQSDVATRCAASRAACTALGTRLVRSIATCLSVQSLFDERSATRAVDLSAFWTHSLLTAELSRSLATASGYQRPDEAYLAGLLHDVGQLILLSALGEPYLKLLATCSSEATLSELEVAQLGVHHGEIGTWLADQWQLDSPFADGILFHHLPAEQIVTAAQLPHRWYGWRTRSPVATRCPRSWEGSPTRCLVTPVAVGCVG